MYLSFIILLEISYEILMKILLHIFSQKGLSKFIRKIIFGFASLLPPFAILKC